MSKVVHPPDSIYNLIQREDVQIQKPPRYMSRYRPEVVLQNKSNKDAMRTMGPPKEEVPSPDKYLKKHSKEPKLPEKTQRSEYVRDTCAVRKPPVPTREEVPPMGIHTKRNFIKTATAVPMKPKPTCVVTRKGHKELLENSGLLPKYINKKDYGEVPDYLHQRNEERRIAQDEYDRFVKEQREQGAMKYLSDEEREAILEGLKKNWDRLHHEYQGLSFVIDTISKKTHRLRLEAEMSQLEKDIKLFERFKTLYIAHD